MARKIDPHFDGNLEAARKLLSEHPSEAPYFTSLLLGELRGQLSRAVLQEAEQLRTRLLGKEPEIFSKVDRLRAEAEFRAAIAFPLLGLGLALLWRASWWAAGVVWLAAALLVWQGRTRRQQSDDALIEALRVERVTSPTLERVRALVAKVP